MKDTCERAGEGVRINSNRASVPVLDLGKLRHGKQQPGIYKLALY
jgi:hypothetical protein